MINQLKFEEHTRQSLKALAPSATVVVPVGSIEQHADHLPVGVDSMMARELALRAAELAQDSMDIVVTPVLPFGYSHHHFPFGGTLSVSSETYISLLCDLGRSLVRDGFSRLVFLNGHGGNAGSLVSVVDRLSYEDHNRAHIAALSYWDLAADTLSDLDLGPFPGHAGRFETSCALALRPDLVRTESLPTPGSVTRGVPNPPPGVSLRRPGLWEDGDGRTDDAAGASAELGEQAISRIARTVADFLIEFHAGTN